MGLYVHDVRWLYQEEVFSRMLELVDENRRMKAAGYQFIKDRALSLGAGLLLHYALLHQGLNRSRPFTFQFNRFGKPFLAEEGALEFNFSHAGIYAVCALDSGPVGVDIEEVGENDEILARRCFTKLELMQVIRDGQVDQAAFCRQWVLKESYVKFVGAGLSLDPLRIEILDEGPFKVRQDGLEQACSFNHYGDLPGYQLALCRQRGKPDEPMEIVTERTMRAALGFF